MLKQALLESDHLRSNRQNCTLVDRLFACSLFSHNGHVYFIYYYMSTVFVLMVGETPSTSLGWFRCGVGFYNKKEFNFAIECFQKSIELDPLNVSIHAQPQANGSYVDYINPDV